jgi:hypothetical protein
MSKAIELNTASGPDAALLALVAKYLAAKREASALCEELDTVPPPPYTDRRQVRLGALYDRSGALAVQIAAAPARTVAGMRAKAEAAQQDLQTLGSSEPGTMAWSVLCDVLALADAA